MKCGSGQHKLTVCATKERYIIRNGIRQQSHSVLRDYSGFVHFSYEDPVRLGNRTYRDWVKSDQSMEN